MILQHLTHGSIANLGNKEEIYFVLDSGREPKLLKKLYTGNHDISIAPILPIARFGDAAFSGPLVATSDSQHELLGYFHTDPCLGIIVVSPENIEVVAKYCGSLLEQEIGNESFFFRFYDPRILLPLLEQIDSTAEPAFFSHVIKKIAVQSGHEKMIVAAPSQKITRDMKQARFAISREVLASLERSHAQRKANVVSEFLESSLPSYARLPAEDKNKFIKQSLAQASLFGLHTLDDCKTFVSEWFLCSDSIQNSTEAMAILSDAALSSTRKLSYIFNYRIFTTNPSPFTVDPIAILARSDLYNLLKNRRDSEGNRLPIDLQNSSDTIARMYYSKSYRTYQENDEQIFAIATRLFKMNFSCLSMPYNYLLKKNSELEDSFCAAVKKELCHD